MSQDPQSEPEKASEISPSDQPKEQEKVVPAAAEESPAEDSSSSDLEYIEIDESSSPKAEKAPRIKELMTSPDSPSRLMMYLSVGFGVMSLLCIILLTYVIITHRHAKKPVALDTEEQTMYVEPSAQENLGTYQVVLKAEPNQPHDFDLRVDIVAQCSSQEACDSLKAKLVEARDVINPILSSVTRDELLTLQGKNRVRRRIAEQLSGMVHEGKVEEIHFTDLTIENGR